MTSLATSLGRLAAVSVLVAAALPGCSDEGCPAIEACDIRSAACQRQIAKVTSCLYGGERVAPPVNVIDEADFVSSEFVVTQTAADLRRGLSLFDLAPREEDLVEAGRSFAGTVGAFYSHETRGVTVIDRGSPMDSAGIVVLLVHEFVHAMQHSERDDAYYEEHSLTFDSSLALSAVREGEADLHEDRALVAGFGVDVNDVNWTRVFARARRDSWQSALADEHQYRFASRRSPYAFGGTYVNRAWRVDGIEAVRGIQDEPPRSMRELLAGYGASPPNGDSFVDAPDDVGLPVLGASYDHVATRRLGAWMFALFQTQSLSAWENADPTSDRGVSGDVFSVWKNVETEAFVSVWRLRFDFAQDAETFAAEIADARTSTAVRLLDRDVFLIAADDTDVAFNLADTVTWTPAPPTDWATDLTDPSEREVFCPRRPDLSW